MVLQLESSGRSAEEARVYLSEDLVVVLLHGLELLPNERYLVENGRAEAVVAVRDQFQQAIGASFRAIVERATGQLVCGFTSHVQVDEEPYAVEVFRLES
jgi:uncharacterized protein YbcI